MVPYKRHDLIWLSDKGRDYALRNIQSCIPEVNEKEIEGLIFYTPQIPAIVRRNETSGTKGTQGTATDNLLHIGFSSPRIIDGVRLRIASKVPPDCVTDRKTPFDVINHYIDLIKYDKKILPHSEILEALMNAGDKYNTQVGCFGSAALQLVTGLGYLRENSDLDIYLNHHGSRQDLEQFFTQLLSFEKQFSVIIDAEFEYQGIYGVKIKEFFAPGKTVLGKGLYNVALLNKDCFP